MATSSCYNSGRHDPLPSISIDAYDDEAFLDNNVIADEGDSNGAPHPMLKHSQSDKCLTSSAWSTAGGLDRTRLLQDTKLVVLHYISGSCSSCSTSPSPGISLLPSPMDSEGEGKFKLWEADSLSNRDRFRKRRFYRPRFHSTPSLVHPPTGTTLRDTIQEEDDSINGEVDEGSCISPNDGEIDVERAGGEDLDVVSKNQQTELNGESPINDRSTRPKLKIDIVAAQNYAATHNSLHMSEEHTEFDFFTPEERLLMDIDAEVSKTLSTLALDDDEALPRTPHTKVADFLQVVGRQYDSVFNEAIKQNVPPTPPHVRAANNLQYNQFVALIDDVTDHLTPLVGWQQIALYMRFGSSLVSHLMNQGQAGVTFVADYTSRLIFERAAGFLVEHGGWGAVANMSPTNPLFTSSSSCSTSQSTSPFSTAAFLNSPPGVHGTLI